MTKKNLMAQANDSSKSIVELSDEDLQQVVGGNDEITLDTPFGSVQADLTPEPNQAFFPRPIRFTLRP